MKKTVFVLLVFVCLQFNSLALATNEKVLVMCRPLVSEKSTNQIENIVKLVNRGLLKVKNLKLVCVYHQSERTDYQPAIKYVADNNLKWISFVTIQGRVSIEDIFKKNFWSGQFENIFKNSHGIIFTGGMDLPPSLYNEQTLLTTEVETPVRSLYEVSFLFHLIGGNQNPEFNPLLENRKNYPLLAICLGAQSMNVAAGGSMYQDLPSQVYGLTTYEQVQQQDPEKVHSSRYFKNINPYSPDSGYVAPAFHRIRFVKEDSILKRFAGKGNSLPYILSSHHQGIKKLGKHLFTTATSLDGKIIEAIEHNSFKYVLGIQFHPEVHYLYDKEKYYGSFKGQEKKFNLKEFLTDNPPSFEFHQQLWFWYSEALNKNK